MTKKERYKNVLDWFRKNMPVAETELDYATPFQLLIAVILSAQCTDKRVNLITPALFSRYPDPLSLSLSSPEEIFEYISSVTYPKSKSNYLYNMSKILVERFDSTIPKEREELQQLPGVGRKTANVISSILYGEPVIAVDTHVFRVARRIGLSHGETPLEVEKELTKNIAKGSRVIAHHWLILHGRYVCIARKPKCGECGLAPFCRYYHELGSADLHKGGSSRRPKTASD